MDICKLILPPLLMVYLSCGRPSSGKFSTTTLKQLSPQDFPCTPSSPDIESLLSRFLPDSFWEISDSRYQKRVITKLAELPFAYIEWLVKIHDENNFFVTIQEMPAAGGKTEFEFSSIWKRAPISITLHPRGDNIEHATTHEVGHAVRAMIDPDFRMNTDSGEPIPNGSSPPWQVLYLEEAIPADSDYINLYAKTDEEEFFAEAFSSYYCSKETQDFINTHFPMTFNYLKRILIPAAFE